MKYFPKCILWTEKARFLCMDIVLPVTFHFYRLLCPYRGDFNILDFNDIDTNGPCMLDKVIVKVRGHETRICEENYRVSLL